MQNINNSETQRRHSRTIQCIEDVEATVDSGAACCVFPRDLRNVVPIRQSAESPRSMMFRTASGQKVAHEGIRTIACSTEYGCTRRLTGAVTSVQHILLAVSRFAETGHQVQFTRTGGCILNERNGSKIPMHRRTESTQSSWVKGVTSDKTITPKIEVFGCVVGRL